MGLGIDWVEVVQHPKILVQGLSKNQAGLAERAGAHSGATVAEPSDGPSQREADLTGGCRLERLRDGSAAVCLGRT